MDEIAVAGSAMIKSIELHLDKSYDAFLCRQIALALEEHEQERLERHYARQQLERRALIVASVILGSILVGIMVAELLSR